VLDLGADHAALGMIVDQSHGLHEAQTVVGPANFQPCFS
jgi:hypothetical protein